MNAKKPTPLPEPGDLAYQDPSKLYPTSPPPPPFILNSYTCSNSSNGGFKGPEKEKESSPLVEMVFVLFGLLVVCVVALWLVVLPVMGLLYFAGILK